MQQMPTLLSTLTPIWPAFKHLAGFPQQVKIRDLDVHTSHEVQSR
jgi:hypothetical protein